MKKTLLAFSTAVIIIAIGTSSINAPKKYTHNSGSSVATSTSCTGCHNSGTGTCTIDSLPTATIAGKSYNVSITTKSALTAVKWGFTCKASGGTFTTTNTNIGLNGTTGLYHKAGASASGTSYSWKNVVWKAPTTAGKITFTIAALAGTGSSGSAGYAFKGTVTTTVALPTPVKLVSFDAIAKGSKVALSWSTASELNASYFNVEKSINGTDFISVGKVNATGNSLTTQYYNFTDVVANGTVYYRLKSVDKDGNSAYSDVKLVAIQTSTIAFNVYPNPVKAGQDIKVKLNAAKTDKATFVLCNVSGKRIATANFNVNEGNNDLSIKTGNITSGTYYLTLTGNSSPTKTVSVMVK